MKKLKQELEKLYNLYTSFIDGIEPALIDNDQKILKEIGESFEELIKSTENQGKTKEQVSNILEEYELKIAAVEGQKAGAEAAGDFMGKEYYRATLQAYKEIQKALNKVVEA